MSRQSVILILFSAIFTFATASIGENSQVYQKCFRKWAQQNCSTQEAQIRFFENQDPFEQMLGWSCVDEVRYRCMWHTVRRFVKEGLPVPQFHGKWPFRRYFGLQEPASVLFSLMNLVTCAIMFFRIWRAKDIQNDMKQLWQHYAALGVFTWIWSAVFHARDNGFTERMDYFSANAVVLFKLYAVVQRLSRRKHPFIYNFSSAPFIGFYIYHVYRLNDSPRFDYGYNMAVNCVVAAISTVLWLSFVAYHCYKTNRALKVWRCAFVVISANLLLCLEIFDFPPYEYTVDAHALWHLGTVPLPIIWSRFVLDDLRYIDECDAKFRQELEVKLRKAMAEKERQTNGASVNEKKSPSNKKND